MLRLLAGALVAAALAPTPATAQIAYAWGDNTFGQLGNGSTTNSNVPVPVSTVGALSGQAISSVAGGRYHSLALANGKVYAWGRNADGALGNASNTDSAVPVAVSTAGALTGLTVTAITEGGYHSLALANGKVYAWGNNVQGQLGINSTTNSNVPVAVSTAGVLNGQTVTAIAGGQYHSLAVANGKVYTWGRNADGQLGNGTFTDSAVPVAVTSTGVLSGQTVTAVAGGGAHSLAMANGKVYAWGKNDFGQLGDGSTTTNSLPVAVSTTGVLNGLTVTALAAGNGHSLAVANGKVYAWGLNASGQLGIGSTTNSTSPIAVTSTLLNSLTVTKVAAGLSSSYALTDTGRLFAWGDNSAGELGIGSTAASFSVPQEVLAPSGYTWTNMDADSTGFHVIVFATPVVPEPGSLLLVLGAAGGIVRLRRHRRRI